MVPWYATAIMDMSQREAADLPTHCLVQLDNLAALIRRIHRKLPERDARCARATLRPRRNATLHALVRLHLCLLPAAQVRREHLELLRHRDCSTGRCAGAVPRRTILGARRFSSARRARQPTLAQRAQQRRAQAPERSGLISLQQKLQRRRGLSSVEGRAS